MRYETLDTRGEKIPNPALLKKQPFTLRSNSVKIVLHKGMTPNNKKENAYGIA